MKKIFLYLFLLVFISSCHKDKNIELPTGAGVYITNEGNFNSGKGEISFYNPITQEITNGLFKAANNYSLGDVVQSMYIKDSVAFIVVNNSAKIEMVKIPSLQRIRTISIAGSSPRYFLPVNDSIGYVSELYANKMWVVNYQTGALVATISVPQYTEHLVKIDEYVFAEGKKIYSNASSKGALFRIRISDNTLLDQKQFAGDAEGIVKDATNHVWILTDADSATSTSAAFYAFDKDFDSVFSYSFNTAIHPQLLNLDSGASALCYVSGSDIFRVENNSFPGVAFIHSSATNLYSIGISPSNGDVYVSDALDYNQSSKIYRYDRNGTLIHSFTAGIISGNFSFSQ